MNSKHFNKILAVLMIFAVTVAFLLRYVPDLIPITGEDHITYDYETKLFDKDSIMSINIVVDEEDWNDLLDHATAKEYIPCDIEINGETFKEVGIRAKGNTSLSQVASDDTTDRYSFKVEFDHYLDQTCYGLDKLALNNIIQDATYMKEYMAYDLLSYMGIPSSLYSFANVLVNGETWGLYLALEVPEESFAARNFGSAYGDLYKPESTRMGGGDKDKTEQMQGDTDFFKNKGNGPMGNFPGQTADTKHTTGTTDATTGDASNGTMPELPDGITPPDMAGADGQNQNGMGKMNGMGGGMTGASSGCDLAYTGDDLDNYSSIWDSSVFDTSDKDHQRIVEALKNISEGNLNGSLDVDTMLRYIAVNSVIVNYDSYFGSLQHNYYLYEKNGELTMLPWDYNLAFAGFQSNNSTSAVNDPIDTPVSGTTLDARPLIGQVLADDENMEQYHEYLNQIVEEYFNSGYWEETIDKVDAMISEYVKKDPSAFYTYDEYKTAVATLKEFGLLRAESITGQLAGSIPSTQDGQNSDSSSLVDASSISITAMGTQGGGTMGGNMGAMNQTPPQQGGGRNDSMTFPGQQEDTSIDWKPVLINLGCIGVAVLAFVYVKLYRRRKD